MNIGLRLQVVFNKEIWRFNIENSLSHEISSPNPKKNIIEKSIIPILDEMTFTVSKFIY